MECSTLPSWASYGQYRPMPQLAKHYFQFVSRCCNLKFVMDGAQGEGCDGNLWRVPGGEDESLKTKMGKTQREASVLRYKEKRQNRLFSKRIRYQVRKVNAEKRPRMKGRFVKKRS
ncbi:CCT motif family protein [Prunus dulcis]|uniref:CCT motif family protein n=1 Tax=Prunus dulcis TaxID=3755 RepID=A0A4Y1R8H6_PRUDU|nr:CCT motif family protein [Prunus dulcis]